MVTRRSTQSVTQRSTRSSELHMTRRPRRLVPPKTVDDTVGLSRKEERELKKALYASLQETRRNRSAQSEVDESPTPDGPLKTRKSIRQAALMSGATSNGKRGSTTGNVGVDESSQDSMISSRSQASSVESKKKIQAQRKFAQGCSAPCTPSTTPNKKAAHSPHNLLDRIPKTEDFLTFLCLRGSHILPPHLDFFNFARDGASGEDSSSRPRTPVSAEQPGNAEQTRESTPESSSSGSNLTEELVEISTFSTPSRQLLASSKAARASAGTPETARGIVSLRQGLTRKVVHTGSTPPSQHSKKYFYTPEKTPSPAGSRLLYGEFTPAKKSASIKCLPASFLRFSPAGKLALDRNGNPPRLTSSKSSASHSPGDRSKGKGVSHRGERQRMPTGIFKPVAPAKSKGRRDPRSAKSSASPVRRILEGASKKLLKKAHSVDRKAKDRRPRRDTKSEKKKHKPHVNAASSGTVNSTSGGVRKRAKPKVVPKCSDKSRDERKKSQHQEKIIRMKRRTSQRLKTLAKILGRKRPNYSLVVSGYADMEEYEEEQKKKAAKSALAKAKAEARARASAKAVLPKQPSKVMTRSSLVTSGKDVVSSAKDVVFSAKDTLDKSDKKSPPLKRPAPAIPKKEQSNLASIIEHKRLRRDSVKEDGGDEVENRPSSAGSKDSSDSGSSKDCKKNGSRSVSSSPTAKKVTPKKSPQEKSTPMSVPSPDPALAHLDPIPTFHPTEDEFSDPISYIASISDQAEPVGMCRIIPPASWKMESKVNEEIRFTTQIQHLHRLFNRWGPGVEQSRAITHHLRDVMMDHNACIPQIGGVEVDLPQLYRMIRDLGGLQNIVDKKQWVKVADAMKIPKAAHDRVTRLYDVYCKYVLPYAMVTEAERQQAQTDVHTQYELSSAEDEAILKGKSMTLSCFSRIARNVQSMWFKDDPNPDMVEAAYWKLVKERDTHVAVQCAHVNTHAQSTAFPTRRESPYFRHSWNLNNLPENKKCILKCLGPVSGATIPTLHVGMLFSTSCWSTDPHRLPYVQYLHSGANTIWYCIPKNDVAQFHDVMKEICPTLLHNDPLWLKEDIAMVKPDELTSRGVHVARCVQQPRQFVVVFPDAYTATVCCGYNVSESVHYATTDWLSLSIDAAKALCASGEKELFSVDTLVCGLCQDSSDLDTLAAALPLLEIIVARELEERHQLSAAGLRCERRLAVEDSPGTSISLARKRTHDLTEDSVCEVCFKICYLSMVLNEHDEQILCLEHGLRHVQRKRHVKAAKLFYRYTEEELTELVQATKDRLTALTNGSAANAVAKKRAAVKRQDSKT